MVSEGGMASKPNPDSDSRKGQINSRLILSNQCPPKKWKSELKELTEMPPRQISSEPRLWGYPWVPLEGRSQEGSGRWAKKLRRTGVTHSFFFFLLLSELLAKLLTNTDSHLLAPGPFPLCSGNFRSLVALIKWSAEDRSE